MIPFLCCFPSLSILKYPFWILYFHYFFHKMCFFRDCLEFSHSFIFCNKSSAASSSNYCFFYCKKLILDFGLLVIVFNEALAFYCFFLIANPWYRHRFGSMNMGCICDQVIDFCQKFYLFEASFSILGDFEFLFWTHSLMNSSFWILTWSLSCCMFFFSISMIHFTYKLIYYFMVPKKIIVFVQ